MPPPRLFRVKSAEQFCKEKKILQIVAFTFTNNDASSWACTN